MAVLAAPLPTLPQVPSTALGDLARSNAHQDTPTRSSKIMRVIAMVLLTVSAVILVGGALGATTANAWFTDDAISKIENWCQPEDVSVPTTSFGGLDGLLGLNTLDKSDVAGQATVLPGSGGTYSGKGDAISINYYRYGFSALSLHSYGTGCGDLIARYVPGLYNIVMTLFVNLPIALTMFLVKLALSDPLATFYSALLGPAFQALATVMRPIVTVLAPVGTLYMFAKHKERLGQVMGAGVYSLACAGFVWWGAGDSSALTTINDSADSVVTTATATVTDAFASSTFPQVAEDGGNVTAAEGGATYTGGPYEAINNALWKGIPLATYATAQMGSDMAFAAENNANSNAAAWLKRLLNANHVGESADGTIDADGKIALAAADAWNNRSYAVTGGDSKTDAWTTGFNKDTDTSTVDGKMPFETVGELADAGGLCGDKMDATPGGTGNGDAENNQWMFNGSCNPSAANAVWKDYFTGNNWYQGASAIVSGSIGSIMVSSLVGLIGFYVSLQKALMFWLLMWAPVFIGIAAFGDEKRRRFASAYAGEFFANVMKQVVAVAALVLLSYIVAAIITSPNVPFFVKPLMVLILGGSLLLLYFIARKIARAAIRGDATIVNKTAKVPQKVAKATAKTVVVAGAAAATGGAALAVAGGGAAGAGGLGAAMSKGLGVAKGALSSAGGVQGAAKAILGSEQGRRAVGRVAGNGKFGKGLRTAFRVNDLVGGVGGQKVAQGEHASKLAAARAAVAAAQQGVDGAKNPADRAKAEAKLQAAQEKLGNLESQVPVATRQHRAQADPIRKFLNGSPAERQAAMNPATAPTGTGRPDGVENPSTTPVPAGQGSDSGANPTAPGGKPTGPDGTPTGANEAAPQGTSQNAVPNTGTAPTVGRKGEPAQTLGQALAAPATTDVPTLQANAQSSDQQPLSGNTRAGTSVTADAVQTPLNQATTAVATNAVLQQQVQSMVANTEGVTPAQATEMVSQTMAGAGTQVLSVIPTTTAMDPVGLSPEQQQVALDIAGGSAANIPAAVATVTMAEQGASRVGDLLSSTGMVTELQESVTGSIRSGADLESLVGMTRQEAVANPEAFLESAIRNHVYGDTGPSLERLDPRDLTATAMYTAVGALNSGDTEGYQNSLQVLSDAIATSGLPQAVTGLHSIDGSALAQASPETLMQAASMAAVYQPDQGALWGSTAQSLGVLRSTLSEEAQASPAGVALDNLTNIAANPMSSVDDIRTAGAVLVGALNTDATYAHEMGGLDYRAYGAGLSDPRANDVFNSDDFLRAFQNAGVLDGTAYAAALAPTTAPSVPAEAAPTPTPTPTTTPASSPTAPLDDVDGFAALASRARDAVNGRHTADTAVSEAVSEMRRAVDDLEAQGRDGENNARDAREVLERLDEERRRRESEEEDFSFNGFADLARQAANMEERR